MLLAIPLLLSDTGPAFAHDGGHGNAMMWRACEDRKINDECTFQNMDHDIFRGACQAMSKALVCVRNQPIEHGFRQSLNEEPQQIREANDHGDRLWPWMVGALILVMGGFATLAVRMHPRA